jgi:hypothetical protein
MNKLILPQQAVNVNSTAIDSAGYMYETYTMRITFKNGRKYDYTRVPNHVFEGLRVSESKGKFINKYVLNRYSFKYVNSKSE